MELKVLPEDAEIISGSKNMANSHRTSILHVVPFNLDTLKFQSTVIMFMVVSHHFSVHCPVDIFGQTSKTEQIFGGSARILFSELRLARTVFHSPRTRLNWMCRKMFFLFFPPNNFRRSTIFPSKGGARRVSVLLCCKWLKKQLSTTKPLQRLSLHTSTFFLLESLYWKFVQIGF